MYRLSVMYKLFSLASIPSTQVVDALSNINSLKKHPHYKIFIAHLKEFFMLGRPEYVGSLDKPVKPHLIKMMDWMSVFSYVMPPDTFLSLCHHVHFRDRTVCRALFSTLFKLLSQKEVYPDGDIRYCTSPINRRAVFTFSHGSKQQLYSSKYAVAIADGITALSPVKQGHEQYIDKTDDYYCPKAPALSSQFQKAKEILTPTFSKSTPFTFKLADLWTKRIQEEYAKAHLPVFNLGNTVVVHAAPQFKNKISLTANIRSFRHLHTWGALTDLIIQFERQLDYDLQHFTSDDWLWRVLMGADLAIQAHQLSAETQEGDPTVVIAGSGHHFHLSLFMANPTALYETLTALFDRVNQDLGRPLFDYFRPEKPPESSAEFVQWISRVSLS